MRILVLAAAATALSGCSFYDQQGTYGVSHISPYAATGVYSGCAVSTYNGCSQDAYSQASYSSCGSAVAQAPAPAYDCASNNYYGDQAQHNQGQQAGNYGAQQQYDQTQYDQTQYNASVYGQGQYGSNCASPCDTGYYAPQTVTTSYAVSHAPSAHYGTQYNASGGHHALRGSYGYGHPKRDYFYGELGAVSQYDIDGAQPLFGVQARLGYQSPNYVGVEIEASKGLTNDSAMRMGPMAVEDSTFEVDKSLGAFGVVRMPLGQVTGLLRAGYHETDFKTAFETSATETETKGKGLAYGAGVEMPLSSASALRVDATIYDTDVDSYWGTSVSYQHKF